MRRSPGQVFESRPDSHVEHGFHRMQRMTWAWGTSIPSKLATLAVQLISVPVVFRTLGARGFAAYASITASVNLIGSFNLGIGGSLVTPIADAVANSNQRKEAMLVQAGLAPLLVICGVGALILLPALALIPLDTLFGNVAKAGIPDLRAAMCVAAAATLIALPFSAVVFLRQAYQEMHITNIIGAVANSVLCIALLVAARVSATLSTFVAVFALIPLVAQVANLGFLFSQRPYVLRRRYPGLWRESKRLLGDGLRFIIGADVASLLIYQWPVYWLARTLPSDQSARFAICMQAVIVPLASIFSLLQPLWPSTADAVARSDNAWLDRTLRKVRAIVIAVGASAVVTALILGNTLIHLWLRKPIALTLTTRACLGVYVLLAIWEYYQFMLALGFGWLREAAGAVSQRCIAFALLMPVLVKVGGTDALWAGLCCSILLWTAWRLPALVRRRRHAIATSL